MASRTVIALIFALGALPAAAQSGPPYQLPHDLHLPQGGGRPLPTPHPYIRPTYYLSCTVGYGQLGAISNMHVWTVTNYGHNTAPRGLAFHTRMGSMFGDFTLQTALAPGASAVFGTPVVKGIIPYRKGDVCEVWFNP
jgi:hypothetical protein